MDAPIAKYYAIKPKISIQSDKVKDELNNESISKKQKKQIDNKSKKRDSIATDDKKSKKKKSET